MRQAVAELWDDDPLPASLVEATQLNGGFSTEYGRRLMTTVLPTVDVTRITDEELRAMYISFPEIVWHRGVNISDLQIYLESVYRILEGGKKQDVASRLDMSTSELTEWIKGKNLEVREVLTPADLIDAAKLESVTKTHKSERTIGLSRSEKRSRELGSAAVEKIAGGHDLDDLKRAPTDPLHAYVRKAGQHEILSPAEERRLARLKDAGDEDAKRSLIEHNLRLVISMTLKYATAPVPLPDLIQEGNLGLIRAVEKFDHRLGYKFSTYATWWIRQAITRAIADHGRTVRIPVHVHEHIIKVNRARRKLEQEHPESVISIKAIAAETGFSEKKVEELMLAEEEVLSLQTPIGDDDTLFGDLIEDTHNPNPEDLVADESHRQSIRAAVAKLRDEDPRLADIIIRRNGLDGQEPQTLEETGQSIGGITRERVRQLETRGLRFLRGHIEPPSAHS